MAEFTNSNIVTVAAGQNVPLTETAVAGNWQHSAPRGRRHCYAQRPHKPVQSALSCCLWREYSHTYRRHRGGDHGRFSDKRRTAYQCDGNGNTGCG